MSKNVWDLMKIVDEFTETLIRKSLEEIKLPIQIEKTVEYYGINIEKVDMPHGQAGVIEIANDAAGMVINKQDSYVRQRFTIAHELGHFISCRYQGKTDRISESNDVLQYSRNEDSSSGFDPEEVFANKFAASILMPKIKIMEIDKIDTLTIDELALLFEVSTQAMRYRLESLKIN